LPNGPDVGGGFSQLAAGYSNPSTLNATSIRIDHTISQKLVLFGRFNDAPSRAASRDTLNLAELHPTEIHTSTLTLGATMTFSPKAINEVRVNYSRNSGTLDTEQDNFGGAVPISRELLLPTQFVPAGAPAEGLVLFLLPTGRLRIDLNNSKQSQQQFNVVDSQSFAFRSHRLSVGADYRRLMPSLQPRTYFLNTIFFSQEQVNSSTPASEFVSSFKGGKPIYTNFSAYLHDTWKPWRRLNIDLGVRYELNPPPHEANGNDPYTVMGLDNLATMTLAPQGTPLWKTTYGNFAPRLGAAYLLRQTAGRETVVRGGFGVFYDTGDSQGSAGFDGFPFSATRFLSNVGFPLDATQLAPPAFSLSPPFGIVYPFDPHLKLPYTLQWNGAIEQSLGKNQTLTASYVGNAGRRLLLQRLLSLSNINPSFTSIRLTSNGATSDYDALQVQYQRRLSRGLQALASYTWSHAIDTTSADSINFVNAFVVLRGNSDFDIRHNFASALTYDIPAVRASRIAGALLRNWSTDVRVNAQSALPLNVTTSTIFQPDGTRVSVRPNVKAGIPLYLNNPTLPGGRVINGAAFSVPSVGQQGNLGRNLLRGFSAWQVDMAIRRQFGISEKFKLQLRAEAFNLFNHPNFGQIDTFSLTSPTFGQATNTLGQQLGGLSPLYQIGGPRSMQFALKLIL